MDETLDIVLSDERITFIEAIFLLRDHLNSLHKTDQQEVLEDLKYACSSVR